VIRDSKLIGNKVDCPKCKFRFLVTAPEGVATPPPKVPAKPPTPGKAPATAGDPAKAKKKPVVSSTTPGVPSKNKPLPKREDDSGEEEAAKKKGKKKQKSNSTMMIGGGIVALTLLVLVIGYFGGLFGGDETPAPPGDPAPKKDRPQAKGQPKEEGGTKGDGKKTPPVGKEVVVDIVKSDITNLLPGDTYWVLKINGREFIDTPIGSVFFEESGDSARAFKRMMGFSGDDIERVVCSGAPDGTFFSVFRLKKDLVSDDLKNAAMEVDPSPKTILKREMYKIKSNELISMLSQYLTTRMTAADINWSRPKGERTLAFSLTDPRTLIIADQAPLEKLLTANLLRTYKTTYHDPNTLTPPKKTATEPKVEGEAPKDMPETEPKKKEIPAYAHNPSYLTIDPALKIMLNQIEGDKPVVAVFAAQLGDSQRMIGGFFRKQGYYGLEKITLPIASTVSLAIRKMEPEKLQLAASIEFPKIDEAVNLAAALQPVAGLLANRFMEHLRMPIGVGTGDPAMPPMPAPPLTQNLISAPLETGVAARFEEAPEATQFIAFQKKDGESPLLTDPNLPLTSSVSITANDRYLNFTLDADWKPVYFVYVSPTIRSRIDLLKGEALMMTGRAHWHSLASGVRAEQKAGSTPPAAFPRDSDASRFELPYPPEQRVSWLVDLLPYLGYETLSRKIRRDQPWNYMNLERGDGNLIAGSAWIPEFLSGEYPQSTWRVQMPNLNGRDLGSTHFVGLTGIGMDAANLADTPENGSKLGMLGYHRQTKFTEVSDGLANTIYMIQVPPNMPRPWIRGGGATAQGVPLEGSIKPFISVTKDGKKGTYAVMADGSIRFLSETIDDKVFQALTTYKGGETIDNLNQIAPVIIKGESFLKKEEAPKVEPKAEPKLEPKAEPKVELK